jgi:hypothetical protein
MSIFEEDLDLQRRALSGLEFPLDPAAELHTRADRVSVEFRRVLATAVGDRTSRGRTAPSQAHDVNSKEGPPESTDGFRI